ncbi:MAG: thioester reductase domain-containing protein [Calditrichia bacterium]
MPSILKNLYNCAEQTPDKLLYCFLDINGKQIEKYSYLEFVARTGQIAAHIHHTFPLKPGERVLLAYPPGLEMICAFFACVRLGLIPVPVYPPGSHGFQSALYKMTFIARDCQAAAVLTNRTFYWSMKMSLAKKYIAEFRIKPEFISKLKWIVTTDAGRSDVTEFPEAHSDILFLQYTSGSTNQPKGVMVSHQNILHNCESVVDHLPIGVSWLPQYHDMGLIGYYLFFALKGGTTYGFSPLDFIQRPALWLETISKYRGTASSAPNFAFEYCLRPDKIPQAIYQDLDLSSLRFLMTAAEPVRSNTYQRFLKKFRPFGLKPQSFFAAYGLAEFTLAVSNYGRNTLWLDSAALQQNEVKTLEPTPSKDATAIFSCGKPLGDTEIRIVDVQKNHLLADRQVGEIWLRGASRCAGYWQRPKLTSKTFEAQLESEPEKAFLRSGDLGFLDKGELYICGRMKDMIIIRGLNFYPQDIESIVETHPLIRKGCVASFAVEEDDEERLIVLAELKKTSALPDDQELSRSVQSRLGIQVACFAYLAPRTIPKTSSGKIIRYRAKRLWQQSELTLIHSSYPNQGVVVHTSPNWNDASIEALLRRYGLSRTDICSLSEAGLDSLTTAEFLHDLKLRVEATGATALAGQIDIRLVQNIAISELYDLMEQLETAKPGAALRFRSMILKFQQENLEKDQQLMKADAKLAFKAEILAESFSSTNPGAILLTGGTGFLGPFLLKSLLEQTKSDIFVLARAEDKAAGAKRIQDAFASAGYCSAEQQYRFSERVHPVCGDLARSFLGLDSETWGFLAEHIHSIYHNGAQVNYILGYESMRGANVGGTNELIRLAFDTRKKVLNHISTTFVFGWSVKDVLYESDTNASMDLLDFGYSQSKWVSEQVVMDAMRNGLEARIFRPALISPSVEGAGYNFDISIRLLTFMLKHGIAVTAKNQVSFTPADLVANNIVAIASSADTVNTTFHVTRSEYASMMDVTQILGKLTGREFEYFSLPNFVPEVINRCGKDDLLFPLLDFFVRSVGNISAMEFKLYDNQNYHKAVQESEWGREDPTLEDTVKGLLSFMQKEGIVGA